MERCTGDQIKAFSFLSCTASDAKGTKEIKKKKKISGKSHHSQWSWHGKYGQLKARDWW